MKTVERRSGFGYDPNRLIISWARRMAEYKNLNILFEDLDRLYSILSKSDKPMMLLVAGKAHPGDNAAKEHIQKTIKSFAGKLSGFAIFVPNYDIALARAMVQGSDLWLNTPEFGREACGTSGMKAIANGVLNATVADGWAAEVDWQDKGWVIDHTRIGNSIYELLENEIGPEFYERNQDDMPTKWISKMKNSINLSKNYSTSRMLEEYSSLLYV
ncbi:MAG: Phosphorylase [Candidatus Woesebacteria bacterium GW2011_GWB1_38_5b]|uniref:Phosphorylase n=1 Tax=Candidatus Woesebacteria bacterium GW2011_GWB1_38_5b TaxID=1618569 RepID=A0A0G0K4T1_9BACT|nr:MAG: Phosphorylase [Candidatus Woesebacteria bacterium GW2011_GWB1_38_5b]